MRFLVNYVLCSERTLLLVVFDIFGQNRAFVQEKRTKRAGKIETLELGEFLFFKALICSRTFYVVLHERNVVRNFDVKRMEHFIRDRPQVNILRVSYILFQCE